MPTRARPLRVLLATLATAIGLACALPAGAQDGERNRNAAVAIAADVSSQGGATKLTFTLSKPVEARAFVMERPDRVVIDLAEVNFQVEAESGRRREGLIQSFRYGLFAPGRSRVVVDLAGPATVARIETVARPRDGAHLLTIELQRADREAFRKAAVASDPAPVPRKAESPEPADSRPLIMVDAGHGGTDPGAIASTGVFEKDIVFGFAQALAARLETGGRYRVRMTRDRDVFVPLAERVRIAREAKADLFISIHADSISSAPQVRGATIYTGSEKATDAESARLAERENKADSAAGTDSVAPPTDVTDILQELMLRETRGFSAGFARSLMGQIGPVMEMSAKPHREAGFMVLRSPDVPSVLVELGYLSSKRDLDLLQSQPWRESVTGAMAKAVDLFFSNRATLGRPAGPPRKAAAIAPVSP
ncbi:MULTISPECIES: N-acetylmuramoyl-L-alanine amidase [Methylobacterium]|uniref:N-acetylmuramoyl-L-alanine amidase n=2 Tax=Pseudomonadota TaxID=1224 RepID=A0ABQ4SSH9_9HYPH|nr:MULTISPECIES: N-acetylmuramoyl-L-alanine amidase [Methylobacterium]PIU06443.1 MAG: N-acetylmuramoyl-L-alanine amidase [Methylobacterium sp. CG09_land_8_20_14_0_10_71_15]PIU14303.1 MAG: N-acetylmuramoyl-L-alanine amidase [Methylobacterium sp. CG08_land_8_20_14_0_20_71_15]GBU16682.1 N-acetylmuramoyl-L-alanine amidase [Methylobacterium sp.]GJE05413.1 N-acetylmuramoyl-L-alanine amidase AmiC [Methylobacterium jeotgali]